MHDIPLIETIAYGLTAALVFGLIARRLGLQPLVGYLIAGIAIGPYTPGFVGDQHIAGQLAELGVILLMFAVGLHFHLKDLLAVRAIAIPGAIGQSLAATIFGVMLAYWIGWTITAGLVLGLAASVASTVVLLKVLIDHGELDTPQGHVAVGWLLVEDILTVLVLVLLPILAASGTDALSLPGAVASVTLKMGLLCAIVMLAGGRLIPRLLTQVSRLRSQELFTLTVLVLSISVAAFSYFALGTSMALGAFLAGMVVGQSSVSHQAASDILPMRDAFAVLFFVSAGMLFDYRVVVDYPWLTVGLLFIVLVIKPIAAFVIVLLCGHPLKTALTVAAALAQIGEFSFILAELGRKLNLMPAYGQTALVAGAIVSISLNAFLFKYITALEPGLKEIGFLKTWLEKRHRARIDLSNRRSAQSHLPLSANRAIVIGYGPTGRTLARAFEVVGLEPVIIETNIDVVLELQSQGRAAIYGDASRKDILESANLSSAHFLAITVPSLATTMAILNAASSVTGSIPVFARCHYERDVDHLLNAGARTISCEEELVAMAMAEKVLALKFRSRVKIRQEVKKIRAELRIGAIDP